MWTRRDSVRVVTAASAAFALTLAVFWSSPIHAVDGTPAEKTIATPVYKDGACEVSAKITTADGILGTRQAVTFIKPGTVPAMQLTVHNTSHEPITSQFKVALNQNSMRDRVSRVPMSRPPAWSKDYEITLGPDETKTIDIECGDLKTAVNDGMILFVGAAPAAAAAPAGNVVLTNAATPATLSGNGVLLTNVAVPANGTTTITNDSTTKNPKAGNSPVLVLNNAFVVSNRVNLLQMSVAEKMPEMQSASSGITY